MLCLNLKQILLLMLSLSCAFRARISLSRPSLIRFLSSSFDGGGDKVVSIPASNVAACIGANNFKSPEEVFKELWARYNPKSFATAGEKTKEDMEREAFAAMDDSLQKALTQTQDASYDKSTIAMQQVANATSLIKTSTDLDESQKAILSQMVKTKVSTKLGTEKEDVVVDAVAEIDGRDYQRDDVLYSIPLCQIDQTTYIVRGKIDRVVEEDGEVMLVEVKTRMRRLFNEVREYEEIQVQTYLQMLPDSIRRAKLIEEFEGETASYIIERDDDKWETVIKPTLIQFAAELHSVIT